jgi:hypothetical protein
MYFNCRKGLFVVALMGVAHPTFANVITDWDEKAVAAVTSMAGLGGTSPYMAQRMMGMVHAAMFDAVNSIERRYRPYLVQLPADPTTSKEAAAAAAAAAVLATINPKTAGEMKAALGCGEGVGSAGERRLRCPRCLSAENHAWRLCANGHHDLFDVAEHEAVRHRDPIPISAEPTNFAGEQRVGNRL